jgi:hypothetical protein
MSQEQVEAKLVEQTTSIVETIKKINEALKDTRISELCEKLYAYAKALDAIVNKKHYIFELQFELVGTAYAGMEYIVRLYVGNEQISSISINTGATLKEMFEKIFSSQEIRDYVVGKIYRILAELAEEVANKADVIQRIKEIEERLVEEDP